MQEFIGGMSTDDLWRFTSELLVGRGGVSLAECILARGRNPNPLPEGQEAPTWCICSRCQPMDTSTENVCCGKRNCITSYTHFFRICLDQQVLTVAIHQRADLRADPISYSPESYRKAAYRQYILWVYKKLGRGNRRVCPSCVVMAIREWYPSPSGVYMGYKDCWYHLLQQ